MRPFSVKLLGLDTPDVLCRQRATPVFLLLKSNLKCKRLKVKKKNAPILQASKSSPPVSYRADEEVVRLVE